MLLGGVVLGGMNVANLTLAGQLPAVIQYSVSNILSMTVTALAGRIIFGEHIGARKLAGFVLFPFGKQIQYGGGAGSFLLNLIWILLFGWELALASAVMGLFWCVTIVGIPFGLQSFKLAKLAFMPFGSTIK